MRHRRAEPLTFPERVLADGAPDPATRMEPFSGRTVQAVRGVTPQLSLPPARRSREESLCRTPRGGNDSAGTERGRVPANRRLGEGQPVENNLGAGLPAYNANEGMGQGSHE